MGLGTPFGGKSKREADKTGTLRAWAPREVHGKHCIVAAWCWAVPESRLFSFHHQLMPSPRQGVWAATTTMQLVRRMEWRPLLLYAYPLGHRVPATLIKH